MKTSDVHDFVKLLGLLESEGPGLDVTYLHYFPQFASSAKGETTLVMAIERSLNNFSFFFSLSAQVFCELGNNLIARYHKMHIRMKCKKIADGGKAVSLEAVLNFMLENSSTFMLLGLTIFYKFENVMPIFTPDEADQLLLWKKNSETGFARPVRQGGEHFFPDFHLPQT